MATSSGTIKKTSLSAYSRPRANGIRAIDLVEGDSLIGVEVTDGKSEILLFSDAGKAVRFQESDVRPMGRVARGVRGMRLKPGQKVVSLIVITNPEGHVLTATQHGYGKRTKLEEYRLVGRGAQGVLSIQTSERNGSVVKALIVSDSDEVLLITDGGVLVRTRAEGISLIGRNTQGVRLINLGEGESLVGLQRVDEPSEEELEKIALENAASQKLIEANQEKQEEQEEQEEQEAEDGEFDLEFESEFESGQEEDSGVDEEDEKDEEDEEDDEV